MSYTPQSETTMHADKPLNQSPSLSPTFTLHRRVTGAVDTTAPTVRAAGMNMNGFEVAKVQVVPSAGSPQPDIEVLEWSEAAGKFVSFATAKTADAPADNTPYAAEFTVYHAYIWVKVVGTVGVPDSVDVLIAGAELDRSR